MSAAQAQPEELAQVDERNPWLGLASFTEQTRAFFFGRDEEIGELARRVQRRLVTVLFGKSGLGKTSLVRAGLVPRLRALGYCPIEVRIDYSAGAPEPAEQIKQAIRTGTGSSSASDDSESPWEMLHRSGELWRDAAGAAQIPLLIFDQFEEIFTLAQGDASGRTRAARFVSDLADLVENRAPSALEARLEQDESLAARFDFARSDYRVLIVLREDYLASLESLKKAMPSLAQNRLRLAPMTGEQALAAVLQPGKGLVSEEVAAAIVRFVAGGAELANAEVEPSLLSLICRELNDTRIAAGRSEISLDLLAGSHATILSHFYERSLADQPAAVRRVIEDELLTGSGFRESLAEEGLIARLAAAGAAPGTLALLVNRRLLRIEERLDARRVELTHDVLCPVVKASREQRHEREARAATERLLTEQRARESVARRSLHRTRLVALGCSALAILALVNVYWARQAAHEAQAARSEANEARTHAERLLAYLSDDFANELESDGRLDTLAEFSQRQIDYFNGLPANLKGAETIRNGALALVHHARAMRALGQVDTGTANVSEALRLLEGLRKQGDRSTATAIALAQAYTVQSQLLESRMVPTQAAATARAAALLRPLVDAPRSPASVREAYVEVLVRLGHDQERTKRDEDAVRTEEEAMRLAAQQGATDLSNLEMAANSAEAAAWLVTALGDLGRDDEARRVGIPAIALADRVIARRPGDRLALHAKQVICDSLAQAALDDLMPLEAVRLEQQSEAVLQKLLDLDPNSVVTENNLGVTRWTMGQSLWAAGQLRAAIRILRSAIQDRDKAAAGGTTYLVTTVFGRLDVAERLSELGDTAGVRAVIAAGQPNRDKLRHVASLGALGPAAADCVERASAGMIALDSDELRRALQIATELRRELQAVTGAASDADQLRDACEGGAEEIVGEAQYQLGDFASAEKAWRVALADRQRRSSGNQDDSRDLADLRTDVAMALAREGQQAEADTLIRPITELFKGLAARNHGDQWLALELANALYVQALAEPPRRATLLKKALALVNGLAPPLRPLRGVRQWRQRILEALQHPT